MYTTRFEYMANFGKNPTAMKVSAGKMHEGISLWRGLNKRKQAVLSAVVYCNENYHHTCKAASKRVGWLTFLTGLFKMIFFLQKGDHIFCFIIQQFQPAYDHKIAALKLMNIISKVIV